LGDWKERNEDQPTGQENHRGERGGEREKNVVGKTKKLPGPGNGGQAWAWRCQKGCKINRKIPRNLFNHIITIVGEKRGKRESHSCREKWGGDSSTMKGDFFSQDLVGTEGTRKPKSALIVTKRLPKKLLGDGRGQCPYARGGRVYLLYGERGSFGSRGA